MLVAHVCDAWLKCLVDYTQTAVASRTGHHKDDTITLSPSTSKSGDPPGTPPPPLGRLAAIKAVIASMKAHTDLLIRAGTFGPVHKKNIRLVTELNLKGGMVPCDGMPKLRRRIWGVVPSGKL